jgi:hypothetical protein
MYLITARNPAAAAGVALAPDGIPSTAPDNMSSEPVNIGTFRGGAEPYELYLPLVVRLPQTVAPLPTATPTASPVSPGRELSALSATWPPSIDGDLMDWAGAAAESLDAARSEKTGGTQPAPTPQDLSLSLSSAWDPAHLYVSALITDDALIRGENGPIWEDDTLELGIQSGGYTRQFSLGPDGRRQALRDGSPAPGPNVIMTVRSVAGGWKLELAIPVAELGLVSLRAGDQFPFTFGYWDDDDGGPGDSHLIRWGTSTNSASGTWGVLRLSSNALAPARPTPTPAPPARALLPASRFPLPPVLDGNLGDWSLVPATTLDDARAESHSGKAPHPIVSDLSLALHAGWDSRHLYFAVAVTDDIVVENESAQLWEDDAVELGVQIGGRVRQFSFAADGRYSELIDGSQRVTPALSHRTIKTPGGWILEVAIPTSEMDMAMFAESASFPFTLGYWDDDDLDGGDSHLILWGSSTNSRPEQWKPLILTATPAF